MLEPLVCLVAISAAMLFLWSRSLEKMEMRVWDVYRFYGVFGSPYRVLSQAAACFAFGMKITGMTLYAPNALTGTLGTVKFMYSRTSPLHAVGRLLHAFAPLIVGAILVNVFLSLPDRMPDAGSLPFYSWVWGSVRETATALLELVLSGWIGLGVVFLMSAVALQAVPTIRDTYITLGGLGVVALVLGGCLVGLDIVQAQFIPRGMALHYYLGNALDAIERTLWLGVLGFYAVAVLAVIGAILFVAVPAGCVYAFAFVRGARGDL